MRSPLTPLSPTTSPLRNRVPRQIRRALPVYLICLLIILLTNLDIFSSNEDPAAKQVKRSHKVKHGKYVGPEVIPRKIWQTWKVGPLGFEERDSLVARTWALKNPGYRYEVLTDNNDMQYVEQHFGPTGFDRQDIVDIYRTLNVTIVKADLLRYLIMYAEGGVYADIDVEALKPVDRFIPDRYNEKDIDMVIGIEIDQPDFKDHAILGKKSMSFCQWTFLCKPRLPVMLHLVENIMKWLNEVAKAQNVPISEIQLDFDEVISGTGPSAFTNAIIADMTARAGKPVTWDRFHDISESKLEVGVLVMTVEAFAAGQGHSNSGNHNSRAALVKHHYHASGWPINHPRYNHPVYGSVEFCNWEPMCVKQWDEDVAAFDLLPPEEQAKKVAEKEQADREEAERQAFFAAQPPPPIFGGPLPGAQPNQQPFGAPQQLPFGQPQPGAAPGPAIGVAQPEVQQAAAAAQVAPVAAAADQEAQVEEQKVQEEEKKADAVKEEKPAEEKKVEAEDEKAPELKRELPADEKPAR